MRVDLEDTCERLLVKTYVDSVLNAESTEELIFDVHKLIHTYEVVRAAKDLVDLTVPAMNEKTAKMIMDGAVLHDIGRVKQFSKGHFVMKANHAHMGAVILEREMPEYKTVIETTRWHSDIPSDKDPAEYAFVLNYVRDADMIANVRYNIVEHERFFNQVKGMFGGDGLNCRLDEEVTAALVEDRPLCNKNLKNISFLNAVLGQLFWIYNLRTSAAYDIAKKETLFPRLRDVFVWAFLEKLDGRADEKQAVRTQLLSLFPDTFFTKNIERFRP